MGPDINSSRLLEQKNYVLDSILDGLKKWDGTIESGIDLIETNQEKLDTIKEINSELYSIEGDSIDQGVYNKKLNLIVEELEKLTKTMKEAKKVVIKEKKLLEKKEQLVENYISGEKKSIFIDKDV